MAPNVKKEEGDKIVVRVAIDKPVWMEYRSFLVSQGITVQDALEKLIYKEVKRVRRSRGGGPQV